MAVKQINRNVYTIDVQVPDAKTSKGKGYATLVSDLRWDLWNETKKEELLKAQWDRQDYIDEKNFLRNQIENKKKNLLSLRLGEIEANEAVRLQEEKYNASLAGKRSKALEKARPYTEVTETTKPVELQLDKPDLEKIETVMMKAPSASNDTELAQRWQKLQENSIFEFQDVGTSENKDAAFKKIYEDEIDNIISTAFGGEASPENIAIARQFLDERMVPEFKVSINRYKPEVTEVSQKTVRRDVDIPSAEPVEFGDIVDSAGRQREEKALRLEIEDIERQLRQLDAPEPDIYRRTQAEYGERMGTGGFGFAARPRRKLPYFDEGQAASNVEDILDRFIKEERYNVALDSVSPEDIAAVIRSDPGLTEEEARMQVAASRRSSLGEEQEVAARESGVAKALEFLQQRAGAPEAGTEPFLLSDDVRQRRQEADLMDLERQDAIAARKDDLERQRALNILERGMRKEAVGEVRDEAAQKAEAFRQSRRQSVQEDPYFKKPVRDYTKEQLQDIRQQRREDVRDVRSMPVDELAMQRSVPDERQLALDVLYGEIAADESGPRMTEDKIELQQGPMPGTIPERNITVTPISEQPTSVIFPESMQPASPYRASEPPSLRQTEFDALGMPDFGRQVTTPDFISPKDENVINIIKRKNPSLAGKITVTSEKRTPRQQAEAMLAKKNAGDDFSVYVQQDLVDEILEAAPNVDAMTAVIEAQVDAGRYISRHLKGNALDLRTKDLTEQEIEQVTDALEAEGIEVIREYKPPHLHLENVNISDKAKVEQMISPEEKAALENINSILDDTYPDDFEKKIKNTKIEMIKEVEKEASDIKKNKKKLDKPLLSEADPNSIKQAQALGVRLFDQNIAAGMSTDDAYSAAVQEVYKTYQGQQDLLDAAVKRLMLQWKVNKEVDNIYNFDTGI